MESKKDSVTFSYIDNDELKAALAGKEPGETCTLTLKVTTKANSDDGFEAVIDEVEVAESYEEEAEEKTEAAIPEDDEDADPVMIVVAKKKKDA